MKFGMNLLLWTGNMNDSVGPVVESLKAMGYDGVEVPIFDADVQNFSQWGQRLDDLGLERTGFFSAERYGELARQAADYSNTKELGGVLYTVYVYPFEVAAVILLVAIVVAIALTLRRRPQTKYQNPSEQVLIQRSQRVRMVKMASESKRPAGE